MERHIGRGALATPQYTPTPMDGSQWQTCWRRTHVAVQDLGDLPHQGHKLHASTHHDTSQPDTTWHRPQGKALYLAVLAVTKTLHQNLQTVSILFFKLHSMPAKVWQSNSHSCLFVSVTMTTVGYRLFTTRVECGLTSCLTLYRSFSETIFPANHLTGAKHPAFSTNHVTEIDKAKLNYKQQQHKKSKKN